MFNRKSIILIVLLVLFLLCPATVMALTGGPGAGGYSFYDSAETDAEAFSWDEIEWNETGSTGIPKESWPALQEVPIGFDFVFYGKSYSHVYISPWGYLTFNNFKWSYCNVEPIPTVGGSADNFIAGLWSYLLPST